MISVSTLTHPLATENTAASRHTPVLYDETLSFFMPVEGGRYLDGTLGMGGHAEGLLQKAEAQGIKDIKLLGIDRDTEALSLAQERLSPFGSQVETAHGRFAECGEIIAESSFELFDGALIDIGVSSLQLDEASRGFSFSADGPLDMRMDQSSGRPASAIVNEASAKRLKEIISTFGEEPMAGRIARAIDTARSEAGIETTAELAAVVSAAYPAKWRAKSRNHPATRTFQALRMAVNSELEELEGFLNEIFLHLKVGGRLAVITFHSLEDRMVKHFFRHRATGCRCPSHIPVCICGHLPEVQILTKKPIVATLEEIKRNPRASSAKLRVAEKL